MITRLPGAQDIVAGSTAEILPSHPHNFAVEVLIETGVIGFTFFAVTLLLLLAGGLRALRHCGAAGAALLGLSAAFWFASLVSYSFWSFWWQATYVLLMALVVAALTPGQVSAGLGLMGSRTR
jgi:O-antigen ligase